MNVLVTDYLNSTYKIIDNYIYLGDNKTGVNGILTDLKRIFHIDVRCDVIHNWSKENGLNDNGWVLANKKMLSKSMILNDPLNILDFTFDELLDPTINYVLHKPIVSVFKARKSESVTTYTLEISDNILGDGKIYHNMHYAVSEMVRCCACSILFGSDRHNIISDGYWSLVEVEKYDQYHTKDYYDCYKSVNKSIEHIKDKIIKN
jgi:hypothetical protein